MRMAGHYEGEVDAGKLVVHAKADVDFTAPVHARVMLIEGKTRGTFVCDGRVTIARKGFLEGTIYARSINVEKGGIFSGSLNIGQEFPKELQRLDERTWFPGGGEGSQTLPAPDFGDFPPAARVAEHEGDEEALHQPQMDLHPRRPRRRS